MKCTHIESMLPLFVGEELSPQQADSVRAHLFACQRCSETAARYETSRSWLVTGGKPDFGDRFYDQLRASVWESIEAQRQPVFRFPSWIWAVSFAVVLLAVAGVLVSRRMSPATKVAPVFAAKADPTPQAPEFATGNALQPLKTGVSSETSVVPRPRSKPRARLLSAGRSQDVIKVNPLLPRIDSEPAIEVVSQPGIQMQKIEIQTADPNVRIIWLIPSAEPQAQQGPLGSETP